MPRLTLIVNDEYFLDVHLLYGGRIAHPEPSSLVV